MEKMKPVHIIIKLVKTSDKEKNLKNQPKRKRHTTYRRTWTTHQKPCNQEDSGVTSLKDLQRENLSP